MKKILYVSGLFIVMFNLASCKINIKKDIQSVPNENVSINENILDSNVDNIEIKKIEAMGFNDNEIISSITTVEDPDGYTVFFENKEFEINEDEEDNYEDDSLTLNCIVDPDKSIMNYINIRHEIEYTYDEYCEGIRLQNESSDNFNEDNIIFGNQGLDAKVFSYYVANDFMLSIYIIEANTGSYVVEVGNYIYDEKEEIGYKVGGAIEEVIDSIIFDFYEPSDEPIDNVPIVAY